MEKHHMQGKIKPDDASTEKTVARPAFSVFPNNHLQQSPNQTRGQK
jgi:hypothetical protein